MPNITQADVQAINLLMLQTTQKYIATFALGEDGDLQMYAEDVAHNINALMQFNATLDLEGLQDAIMQQDTLVREFYIAVLHMIECISEYED